MADICLTPAQQAVVENEGGALLVSAAAGSGKTKVLVDRLLRKVCDPAAPANIDDFLIITYTKAAASELRGKIAHELAKRLALEPENRHLQRQTARIALAQISTVHAFCTSILRSYCHLLDLPADFRVAEEQETAVLRQQTLDDVLTDSYTQWQADPGFRALIDQLGFGRDDRRLGGILLRVYEAACCRVDPEAWMTRCEAAVPSGCTGAEETVWGAYLLARYRDTLQYAARELAAALDSLRFDAVLEEKYTPLLTKNLEAVRQRMDCTTWDAAAADPIATFGTLPPVRKCDDPALKQRVQNSRKACLAAIRDAQACFYAPSEVVLRDLQTGAAAVGGLMRVLRRFMTQYTQEKRRRKLLDFSDLEHEAIRLLTQRGSGQPTQTAREIAAHYREILVDEYQDSNAVQECIFEAVSRAGQNRFMVGDVKQSIYRFRLADPSIFLQKYDTYADFDAARSGQPRKILLSENFRSRPEILNCVNDVFSLVMSRAAGELEYTEREALKNGRAFPPTPQPKIELHALALEKAQLDDDQSPQKSAQEAAFVAARIARLLRDKTPITDGDGTRPVTPEDIVILLRSPGNTAGLYAAALARQNIPCVCDRSGDILQTTEIEVLCALLAIVDNPHQDIPLITALGSQVFAFSPDALALPRTKTRRGDYIDALRAAAGESEQYQAFLMWLDDMRAFATRGTLRELLDEILRTTGLESIYAALPDGLNRAQNIAAFCAYVDRYDQTQDGGLSGLNHSLALLRERGTPLPPAVAQSTTGAVRIMSIHRSKGLEFPVVVLADLSRRFNLQDAAQPVLVDEELLIGTNIVDTHTRTYYASIAKTAIAKKMTAQAVSEELRVLYVAMTRAQELLIMTYCSGQLESALKKWNEALTVPLRPEVSASVRCPGDWVLLAALCRTEAGQLFAVSGENDFSSVRDDPWAIQLHHVQGGVVSVMQEEAAAAPQPEVPAAYFDAPYAHPNAVGVPSKLTATALKGRTLDQEAAENAPQTDSAARMDWRRPSFLPQRALTPRERGNATHLFMQYADYAHCTTQDAIAADKQRLVQAQFLTAQQAEAVNDAAIARLFASALGTRILQSGTLRREFKFSLLTDAGAYFPQAAGEQVLLQGVVDCFWIENDALVIVDFKTDRIHGDLAEKAARYTPQVRAYATALSRIYSLPVRACMLYFFDADQAVTL